MSTTLLILPLSYLLGCFTTGYYLVRLLTGQDIRDVSSGNVGSRNVGRLLGTKGFVLTFIGDAGKGALAVWLAHRLGGGQLLATAAVVAVTAGHIWPVQLRFRGGKGFATFVGGMILLDPLLLLLGTALAALLYPLLRRTSQCGLIALACTPLLLAVLQWRAGAPLLASAFPLYLLLVLLVLYAHRENIPKVCP
jgi:glycerol-3-phosphate acyltransferase PlsY